MAKMTRSADEVSPRPPSSCDLGLTIQGYVSMPSRPATRRRDVAMPPHMKQSRKPTSSHSSTAVKVFAVVSLVAVFSLFLNTVHTGDAIFSRLTGRMVHVTFTTQVKSDIKTAFTFLSDWTYIEQWDPNVPKSKKVRYSIMHS